MTDSTPRSEPHVRAPSLGRPVFTVTVLGAFVVRADGVIVDIGGPKPTQVLAMLISHVGEVVTLDALIDGLWGDEPPPTARKAVQVHISNLRRALGPDFPLTTAGSGYTVGATRVHIDSAEFDSAVSEATALLRSDPARAVRLARAALQLWTGPAYSGVSECELLSGQVLRLSDLRLRAQTLFFDARLRLGEHLEIVGELDALSAEHPYREDFRRLQMLALYRSGRQAEALRAYQRTRTLLIDELGLEPSPELRMLNQQILEQSPELDTPPQEPGELRAFLATDIEGSTGLWEADPDAMARAIQRHDELLDDAVAARGGIVFKRTGDGIYATFEQLGDAADAAIAAQQALHAEPWPTTQPIRVRMAVDEGVATERDGDWFGRVMNRVSRVMSSGHGGQVLTRNEVTSTLQQRCIELGQADYKGLGRLEISQLVVDGLPSDFPPLQTERSASSETRAAFGQTVRGYELRERLGEGTHAIVYRAYQSSIGREVAVKVIRPEHANQPGFVKRFEAEAQYVAQLEHPHIVPLYDYWRDPYGAYLVMQWVRSGSLATALETSPWDPPAAMRMLDQVGAALSYAHRHGVVHRDLKPGNVLLDADGNAYLSDFGIASQHLASRAPADASSAAYVAPEELVDGPVGPASDLYAFGLLANEVMTGTRPLPGKQPASVVDSRPGLPPALDAVLARATAADPSQRFARIEDFLRALRQVFGSDVTTRDLEAGDGSIEVRNPYKGLRAFNETDAGDYFGREDLTTTLLARVRASNLTVVVGPSGSGKSSLVKAGLLPAVRIGGVRTGHSTLITEMFPGTYPFEELEAALLRVAVERPDELLDDLTSDDRGLLRASKQILPDDDSDLLLVIDQFEELFTLTANEQVRKDFLDNLVTIAGDERSRVRVVATMRADFFDHPLEYPQFGALMSAGLVTVSMPAQSELARAISEPARMSGLDLEPGLVSVITRDVADEPGALPLLQYALTELFDAREGRQLTIAAYERTGGVIGALARRAEEIYLGLPEAAKRAAQDIFIHLVSVDDDSDDTRRRVRRTELDSLGLSPAAVSSVITDFGSFRLLSFDRDPVTRGQTVEVAHEALIREWPRYRDWMDGRRESLVLERRLQTAALEWETNDRDRSFLFGGGRLDQYVRLADSPDARLTNVEHEFLDESRKAEADDERHAQRRRRRVVAALGVLAALAVVIAAVALVQRRRAEESALAAHTAADQADALRVVADRATADTEILRAEAEERAALEAARAAGLTATSLAGTDAEAATLVAIEAQAMAEATGETIPEVITGLWEATRSNHLVNRFEAPTSFSFMGAGARPNLDATRAVHVRSSDAASLPVVDVIDPADGSVVTDIVDPGNSLFATWDTAAGTVVTGNGTGEIAWWDADTGDEISRRVVADEPVWHVVVNDDHIAFSQVIDQTNGVSVATLTDRETGAEIATVPNAYWSSLSPNGRWWAVNTADAELAFFELPDGDEVWRAPSDLTPIWVEARSDWIGDQDAMWMLRLNGTLARVDVGARTVSDPQPTHTIGVDPIKVSSSPDGRFVAVGDGDARVHVHDADTLAELAVLSGHSEAVSSVEWAGTGERLISSDQDGTAILWDLTPTSASPLPFVGADEYPLVNARFDGGVVALSSRRARGTIWDAVEGRQIESFERTIEVQDLEPIANGRAGLLAVPGDDSIRIFDTTERQWSAEFAMAGIDAPFAISDDGRWLVAGTSESTAPGTDSRRTIMVDIETGEEIWRLEGFVPNAAHFTQDGTRIVWAGFTRLPGRLRPNGEYTILVLDAASGDVLGRHDVVGSRGYALAVTPDGRRAALASGDEFTVYDVNGILAATDPAVVSDRRDTTSPTYAIALSDDGSTVFTGSFDGALRAWDFETLDEVWSISNGFVVDGLTTENGLIWFGIPNDIPVGLGNGAFGAIAIPSTPGDFAEYASTLVTRNLTDDECRKYLGGPCAIVHDVERTRAPR